MALYKQRSKPPKGGKSKSSTAKHRIRRLREEQQNSGESPSIERREHDVRHDHSINEEEKETSALQKYRKNHIPTHHKLTAKHVRDVLFHLHHNVEANIQVQLKKCQVLKNKINYWARCKIKEKMLSEAVRRNVTINGKLISKFTQIGEAYMLDETTGMHSRIHAVIYKQFQAHPGWRRELEEEYMQQNHMCYEDEDTAAVGFVRGLISEQYNEIKRGITDRVKKSHGTFVRIRKQPKARKTEADQDDGDKSRGDANSMEGDLVDTEDDKSVEDQPVPKLNKGIFHSSYIRVEKKSLDMGNTNGFHR